MGILPWDPSKLYIPCTHQKIRWIFLWEFLVLWISESSVGCGPWIIRNFLFDYLNSKSLAFRNVIFCISNSPIPADGMLGCRRGLRKPIGEQHLEDLEYSPKWILWIPYAYHFEKCSSSSSFFPAMDLD